jgi:hypothetical protein
MTLNVAGMLADAWKIAKRDRDPLLGVAGLFLFVPQFGSLLLMQPQPPFPDFEAQEAKLQAYVEASQRWTLTFGLGMLLAAIFVVLGMLVLTLLYLDPRRPDVKAALGAALRLLPRVLLASLLISMPLALSLQVMPLLILPALYLEGRLLLVIPVLVAARPLSVAGAVRRSWALTRGHGLVLAGVACITFFGGPILASPFAILGKSLDGAPLANPVVAAILDGAAAAGLTIGGIAAVLIQVLLYRRLSPSSRGI